MRVISGSAKGRKLLPPKDNRIRPTADRVKESLFNILAVQLGSFDGRRVLDVFAGTGNLGIEALSRGAADVVFIDENRDAAELVKRNLDLTGFAERGDVIRKDALSALKSLGNESGRFDLVFIDPPYRQGICGQVLEVLASSALIGETSVVVAETAAKEELPCHFGSLEQFDMRVYGDTAIRFFSMQSET